LLGAASRWSHRYDLGPFTGSCYGTFKLTADQDIDNWPSVEFVATVSDNPIVLLSAVPAQSFRPAPPTITSEPALQRSLVWATIDDRRSITHH